MLSVPRAHLSLAVFYDNPGLFLSGFLVDLYSVSTAPIVAQANSARSKIGQRINFVSYDRHTVEDLQQFSNTRTPSPPWVRVVRVTVPMSCCDQAAEFLIDALGGESATKGIVGGTKWWQIRGINGCGIIFLPFNKEFNPQI